ncbi:MAG: hypothetical protein OQL19_11035 [Gammaproteobacteria bacterium]|nr:hypothetical protein [Gammaproteobacteria bacterium]
MSIDGIWVLEIAGVFGWERLSTVFLEKGRYLGGGPVFFTQGKYVVKKNKATFDLQITKHKSRDRTVVYGEIRKQFSTQMKANIKKDKIVGTMRLVGAKSTAEKYHVRLIKKSDLPKISK